MLESHLAYLKTMALFAKIGWVDIVGLILFFWGILTGIRRGLELELPMFLEITLNTLVTLHFYQAVGGFLEVKFAVPEWPAELLSFMVLALVCGFFLRLFFNVLGTFVSIQFMAVVSRLGGGVAGCLRLMLFFSLVSYFLLMLPLDFFKNSFGTDRSWSGPFFAQASEKFYRLGTYYLPSKLKESGLKTGAKAEG